MKPDTHFGEIAAQYKTFRPTYPPALFEWLASIAPNRDLAWDCATGNGQAACALKPYFQRVIATDVSVKQIAAAERLEGVEYVVAAADQSSIASASVDLVTVAQALHWFDLPRFFAEVKRVCKPDGILACWCYSLLTVNAEIDVPIAKLYVEILGPYWPIERKMVDEHYANIDFPFIELNPQEFAMTQSWNLDQLVGYLGTWSAVAAYEEANGANPIALIWEELRTAWGSSDVKKTVTWPLHLRAGRLNSRL